MTRRMTWRFDMKGCTRVLGRIAVGFFAGIGTVLDAFVEGGRAGVDQELIAAGVPRG